MSERLSIRESPLLGSLLAVARLYHHEVTAETVLAGLPVDKKNPRLFEFDPKKSKSLFSRAAEKAGFSSTLEQKKIREISVSLLPCILLLEDEKACVLLDFDDERKYVNILIPGFPEQEGWVAIDELEKDYLGYMFLLKKKFGFDLDDHKNIEEEVEGEHWFWGTLSKVKGIYADVLIGSFLINLFVLALPLYIRNVYDRVIPNSAFETLWVLTLGVGVIFLLEALLKFLRSYFMEIAAKKSDIIMSSIIFEKVMDMKISAQQASIGAFSSDLKQYEHIRSFLTSSVITSLIDLPFSVIFLVVVYFVAGDVVIIPVLMMFLIIVYALIMKNPIRNSIKLSNKAASVKNSILIEGLNARETIKAFNYNNIIQWRLEEATGNIAQKSLKSRVLNSSIGTFTQFLIRIQTIGVIVYSVYLIDEGKMTMGSLLVAYILSSRAVSPMGKVVGLILHFNQVKQGFATLDKLMKSPLEHPKEKVFINPGKLKGAIEFKDVSFIYPNASSNAVKNISFKINEGEHVAIMGEMGSGKTSIANLLMGFYEPNKGSVMIDDIELGQYAPSQLRKHFAYVPQDIVLFQGTIKDNIAIKDPGIDSSEIVAAAKMSGAINYINLNPNGFNMRVNEKGHNLSGGQRQSIAIARAFIGKFTIALLDEPTAHIDDKSEFNVLEGLKEKLVDKTAIIITHKKVLLSLADRIIVMKNGKIIMDGPKHEVLTRLEAGSGRDVKR